MPYCHYINSSRYGDTWEEPDGEQVSVRSSQLSRVQMLPCHAPSSFLLVRYQSLVIATGII